MRALALLCLACSPTLFNEARPVPSSAQGNIQDRLEATAECLRALGYTGLRPVTDVRVMPAREFRVPGYDKPQRGVVYQGRVIVGCDTHTLQHESTIVMLNGYHSHALDAPTILCEHAGAKPVNLCE